MNERFGFLGRRREAGEVEGEAANQGARVGIRRGRDASFLHASEGEEVHVIARPSFVFELRERLGFHRLIGPMFATFFDAHTVGRLGRCGGHERGRVRARVGGAELHPLDEVGDLRRRERLFRRHLELLVPMPDALDEQRVVGFAGHDGRTGFAALGPAVARVEAQAALGLLRAGAVALVAMLGEQRPNAFLEECDALLRSGGAKGNRSGQGERKQQQQTLGKHMCQTRSQEKIFSFYPTECDV